MNGGSVNRLPTRGRTVLNETDRFSFHDSLRVLIEHGVLEKAAGGQTGCAACLRSGPGRLFRTSCDGVPPQRDRSGRLTHLPLHGRRRCPVSHPRLPSRRRAGRPVWPHRRCEQRGPQRRLPGVWAALTARPRPLHPLAGRPARQRPRRRSEAATTPPSVPRWSSRGAAARPKGRSTVWRCSSARCTAGPASSCSASGSCAPRDHTKCGRATRPT